MARQWRTWAGAAFGAFLLALAAARAADVVPDLDKVEGIKQFDGPPAARELLKRNGFVVVPRFYRQIFSPYIHSGLPPFITTDSLHRTFHVIFEEQIKRVETALAGDVAAITKTMLRSVSAAEATEAQRLARGYFLVAQSLLSGDEAPVDAPKEVAAELALIRAAQGVARSPLFGYDVDYSQLKPRGFYTETPLLQRYFRAMSWYGNAAFRLVSDRETRAAMLIAERFAASEGVRKCWEKADRLYTHLIAPADDLTPLEYYPAASYAMDASAEDPLSACKRMLRKLRDPKINSMVIPPQDMPRWRELSKGLRFFGKRYVPDSEFFMDLTDPAVPGRGFPSGLDVMAVLGSARARELQDAAGESKLPGYGDGFAKSRAALDALLAAKEPSHYVETLKLTQTLLAPPGPEALPFMRTPAYADKNLMTALAMWTSLRHAWMLQAKQSVNYLCLGDEPPPGWVEPNFAFHEQLHKLVLETLRVLGPVEGVEKRRLEDFGRLVRQVAATGRKQADRQELGADDRDLFASYGPTIARLGYFEEGSWKVEDNLPWMSLVADVHTELQSGQCLEEAVGAAMPIYVTVPHKGKCHLMAGGVYSYYEFRQPIGNRLADEEWRERLSAGRVPPIPGWASSFAARLDATALIERMKQGQLVRDAAWVGDSAIEAFLEGAIAPGGVFDAKWDLPRAMQLYARVAGRKAVPKLLDYLTNPTGPAKVRIKSPNGEEVEEEFPLGCQRAFGAARALKGIAGPEHIPELEKLARGGDEDRAAAALRIIGSIQHKAAESSVLSLLKNPAPKIRRMWILRLLAERASREVTPTLIEAYQSPEAGEKEAILQGLGSMWCEGTPPDVFLPRWPAELDERTEGALRTRVRVLVLEALADPRSEWFDDAVKAAGLMRLREAIPFIEIACIRSRKLWHAQALGRIGGDEAVCAVLRLTRLADWTSEKEGSAEGLLLALQELKSPRASTRLLDLLESDGVLPFARHGAAVVLLAIYPDGPRWPRDADDAEERRVGAAWRVYLKARGTIPK